MKKILFCMMLTLQLVLYAQSDVVNYQLKNGLKIMVVEDHRAPLAVFQLWYKVGSVDERDGISGISHTLEHMMFKGTPKYGPGIFSRKIAQIGGQENAMTGADYTVYFEILPAKNLTLSFELEADRMRHLLLDPNEFKKEIEVVKEERRMRIDDDPNGLAYERFKALAHLGSPYRYFSGSMHDLNYLTVQDLRRWYHTWYLPNNAVLVVVGDVQAQQIERLAQQYFGDIPARSLPLRKTPEEIPNVGERKLIFTTSLAKVPILILGFNTPSLLTIQQAWQVYALDVIRAILGGGDSARLMREVVRRSGIASTVSVNYDLYSRYDGVWSIYAMPAKQHTTESLKRALQQQITRLQRELISTDELQRIKTQIMAEKIYNQDSLFTRAFILGNLAIVGLSAKEVDDYAKHIQALTPEQIRQVANIYLIPERLSMVQLIPQAKIKERK